MTIPRNAYRLTTFLIIGHGVAAWAGKPSVQTHPWQMQTFAIHTQAPPKIDGDLSDWDFSKGAIEINGTNARENGIRDGDWDGDQDASAVCALRWDASNLYAAAQVIDDHPMPATNPVDYFAGNSPPDAPWRHDSWMLYFETIGQPAGTGRYHPKRTCPVLTHPHIGLTLATEQARNVFLPEGSDCQTRTTKTGYVIECRLPFAALGFDVREGDRLRLGHILVDVDPDQWGQIGAHFGGGYDARTWGRLRLVSEKGVGADLILGQERLVVGDALRIKCSADAMAGGSELKSITISGGEGFRKRTIPVSAALQPGGTALAIIAEVTTDWPAGSYQVTAAVAGATVAPLSFRLEATRSPVQPEIRGVQVIPSGSDERRHLPFPLKTWPVYDNVTRGDYLTFIRERSGKAKGTARSFYDRNDNNNSVLVEGMFYAAFDYRQEGKPEDARFAVDLLKRLNDAVAAGTSLQKFSTHDVRQIHFATQWLRDSAYLDPMLIEAKRALRLYMPDFSSFPGERKERGAMNRSMHVAWSAELALHYIPDLPEADKWREYIEAVWNDWYEYRDIAENSTNYDPIDLEVLIDWIPLRSNPEQLWNDPQIRAVFERHVLRTLPVGTIPSHGDCCPFNTNWHGWVAPFEVAAAKYKDGRYRWAAARLFAYALTHAENIWSWGYIGSMGAERLAAIYDQIDTSVQPIPIAPDTRVTQRQRVKVVPSRDLGPGKPSLLVESEKTPDKAMFTSGSAPEGLAAFFDLCGDAGHSLSVSPNLCGLVDKGAVLLHDLGFYEKGPEYHNMVWLEDLEGVTSAGEERTTIEAIVDGKQASYGRFRVENFQGWPVTTTREVLFAKNHFLAVKDTVHFARGFRSRLGPTFQLKDVGPAIGDHWVNSYIPVPYSRPLADYPLGRWYNPPRDLLVWFAPQADRQMELVDRKEEKINQLPARARYTWSGLPADGDAVSFTTLLLPHDPAADLVQLTAGIAAVIDTPETTVLQVAEDTETVRFAIFNQTGKQLNVDKIAADARQGLITMKKGAVASAWLQDCSKLAFEGNTICSSGSRALIQFQPQESAEGKE